MARANAPRESMSEPTFDSVRHIIATNSKEMQWANGELLITLPEHLEVKASSGENQLPHVCDG